MSKYDKIKMESPLKMSLEFKQRIRDIRNAREKLQDTLVPGDLMNCAELAIQHLALLESDLQHDLDAFNAAHNLTSQIK